MNFPLNTAVVHSPAHRVYGTLPELILSALLPRNSLKAAIWDNHRAYLICLMSLKDHCLLLLNAQGLENCFIYILSLYLFIYFKWESKSSLCSSILSRSRSSFVWFLICGVFFTQMLLLLCSEISWSIYLHFFCLFYRKSLPSTRSLNHTYLCFFFWFSFIHKLIWILMYNVRWSSKLFPMCLPPPSK